MGIFSPIVKNAYEGFDSEITGNMTFEEAVLQDDSLAGVFDESMDLTECGLQAVIDINENYNMIEKTLMGNELVYMEQTGKEYEYTDAICEGFLDSVKNFLKKVWEKIKALFHRFVMKLDSYMKNDKDFVNKYKKDIYSGKDLSDFTFKGYKFTNFENVKKAMQRCEDSDKKNEEGDTYVKGAIKHYETDANFTGDEHSANHKTGDAFKDRNEKFADNADKSRGDIARALGYKGSGGLDASEFKKALFEALRNNESEKEELDKIELTTMATELVSSKDTKKTMNEAYKESDRVIRDMEKKLNQFNKDALRGSVVGSDASDIDKKKAETNQGRVAGTNYYLRWVHFGAECLTQVNAAVLQALNDRSRQYKACIVKAVAHKSSNESAIGESYTPTQSGSFLADLALR